MSNKSAPRWTEELEVMRKRVNALRRRYQRTKKNEELREQRKTIFRRESKVGNNNQKRKKNSSWKEYCNMTSSTNPWNDVYKLAA